MSYISLNSNQVDKGSPVDETLMTQIKTNEDDLDSRLQSLESGGSSSSSSSTNPGDSNSLTQYITTNSNGEFLQFEFEENSINRSRPFNNNDRFINNVFSGSGATHSPGASPTSSRSAIYIGNSNDPIKFLKKRGENIVGICIISNNSYTSFSFEVDGQPMTNYQNELNVSYSSSAVSYWRSSNNAFKIYWIKGLDKTKNQIISIKSGCILDSVFHGYFNDSDSSKNDNAITIPNQFLQQGSNYVKIGGSNLTFQESNYSGATGGVITTSTGTLSVVNSVDSAMTYVKKGQYDMSALTTIPVIGNKNFPNSGFCEMLTPFGEKVIFSYSSKVNADLASNCNINAFNGLIFNNNQNVNMFDFEIGKFETTFTNNTAVSDCIINLVGTGGASIDSTNNKFDFEIIYSDSTTSTHAITIPSGLYSMSDGYINLCDVIYKLIIETLNAANENSDIGLYIEYDSNSKKTIIGCNSDIVTSLSLKFQTGSNTANSIKSVLGFNNTDKTGSKHYESDNQINMNVELIHVKTAEIYPYDNNVFYSSSTNTLSTTVIGERVAEILGYKGRSLYNTESMYIYPSSESTGVLLKFLKVDTGSVIECTINGESFMLPSCQNRAGSGTETHDIIEYRLSYPKGSKEIKLKMTNQGFFRNSYSTPHTLFLGGRELIGLPNISNLNTNSKLIGAVSLKSPNMYKTKYGLTYTPASGDHLSTITFSGTWTTGSISNSIHLNECKYGSNGAYMDVTFTISGSYGGIGIDFEGSTSSSRSVSCYLTNGSSITESNTTYIRLVNTRRNEHELEELLCLKTLPAGTYTLRIKNNDSGAMYVNGINIYDMEKRFTNEIYQNAPNDYMAQEYNINVVKNSVKKSSTPVISHDDSIYRYGFDKPLKNDSFYSSDFLYGDFSYEESISRYYGDMYSRKSLKVFNTDEKVNMFFKGSSISLNLGTLGSYSQVGKVMLNGDIVTSNLDLRKDLKNGTNSSTSYVKYFNALYIETIRNFSSKMSNTTVVPLSNTTGLKIGMNITLSYVESSVKTTITRKITNVSANVSITIDSAVPDVSKFTTTNQSKIDFSGNNVVSFTVQTDSQSAISSYEYTPMKITKSNLMDYLRASINETVVMDMTMQSNESYVPELPKYSDGTEVKLSDAISTNHNIDISQLGMIDNLQASEQKSTIIFKRGLRNV